MYDLYWFSYNLFLVHKRLSSDWRYISYGLFIDIVSIFEQELASLRLTVDKHRATNERLKRLKVTFLFSSTFFLLQPSFSS